MNLSSIVSVWVESSGTCHGWRVIAKDRLGGRHAVGEVYVTLDAALEAARDLKARLP